MNVPVVYPLWTRLGLNLLTRYTNESYEDGENLFCVSTGLGSY